MQVASTMLAQAIVPEPAAPSEAGTNGFAATLHAEQAKTESPPGAGPSDKADPPNASSVQGGEVAINEPNAPSQTPDSKPEKATDKIGATANAAANPVQAMTQALSFGGVSTLLPTQPTTPGAAPSPLQTLPFGGTAPVLSAGGGPTNAAKTAILTKHGANVPKIFDTSLATAGAGNALQGPKAPLEPVSQTALQDASAAPATASAGPQVAIDPIIAKSLGITQVAVANLQEPTSVGHDPKGGKSSAAAQPPSSGKMADPMILKVSADGQGSATPQNAGEQGSGQGNGGQSAFESMTEAPLPTAGASKVAPKADPIVAQVPPMQVEKPLATGAPAAPTAVQATHGLSQDQTIRIIQQTADRIALLSAAHSRETVTVHLSPPEMGDLTLVVRSTGARVDAEITATNDSVKQALQQSTGQLSHQLQQRGLELNSVSVGSQGNYSTQGESNPRQAFYSPQNPANAATFGGAETREAALPFALVPSSTKGVDLMI